MSSNSISWMGWYTPAMRPQRAAMHDGQPAGVGVDVGVGLLAEEGVAFGLVVLLPPWVRRHLLPDHRARARVVLEAEVLAVIGAVAVDRDERAAEVARHVHGLLEPRSGCSRSTARGRRRSRCPRRSRTGSASSTRAARRNRIIGTTTSGSASTSSGRASAASPHAAPNQSDPPAGGTGEEPVREQDDGRSHEHRRGLGAEQPVLDPEVRVHRRDPCGDQTGAGSGDLASGEAAQHHGPGAEHARPQEVDGRADAAGDERRDREPEDVERRVVRGLVHAGAWRTARRTRSRRPGSSRPGGSSPRPTRPSGRGWMPTTWTIRTRRSSPATAIPSSPTPNRRQVGVAAPSTAGTVARSVEDLNCCPPDHKLSGAEVGVPASGGPRPISAPVWTAIR